jgi:hypothetical protein
MAQETIKCPKCGNIIRITEAIYQDIESSIKAKYEKEMESRLTREKLIIEEK